LIPGVVLATTLKLNQTVLVQSTPPPITTSLQTPSPTRPAYCVPLPRAAQQNGSPTPTQFPLTSMITITPLTPQLAPSVTPRVYANTVDLSPEVPLQDKCEYVVFRCDGTFDKFLAGPGVDVYLFLNLGPGDVVINTIPPASLMGHEPPESPDWATISPPTSMPYPLPVTPLWETPTPFAYPVPATPTPGNISP